MSLNVGSTVQSRECSKECSGTSYVVWFGGSGTDEKTGVGAGDGVEDFLWE